MAAPKTIRILVVDDHYVVRSGVAASIEIENDLKVVAEAGSASEAIAQYQAHRPDVVLMDLRLPDMTGIEATAELRRIAPDARVLMFTTFEGDQDILRALQAGALGYLLKSAPREEVLAAIRAVASGRQYLPGPIAQNLAARMTDEPPSPRELDVLRLICQGRSNKEIGAALFITEDTVKRHASNLFAKLRVADRAQATAEAIRRGFIHLD